MLISLIGNCSQSHYFAASAFRSVFGVFYREIITTKHSLPFHFYIYTVQIVTFADSLSKLLPTSGVSALLAPPMDYSSKVYCQGALSLLRSIWSPYIVQCIDGKEQEQSNAGGAVTTGGEGDFPQRIKTSSLQSAILARTRR